ncbi:unnamed protein product [Allacma fusca]|uniref:Armadillo repeat-containing domain-containing protein n=1 Tax=Allacma fusca TaxID=39272 RepID=A0A8J2KAI0_9HEXA|nr:unnamed protein product [Allacma fusca]
MASGSGTGTDRAVNKVAICSAIFAGFAYVGYSVVRTAFHRRRREGVGEVSYPEGEARLFFRRLSQTTQTDALLGNLDASGTGLILRPLSVQERIRELNFRARHFADTMLALQGPSKLTMGGHHLGPRSLQCSPWSSPRILSPVDIRHFIASRSSDNLSLVPADIGSPVRRRWSRKSIAKKSPDGAGTADDAALTDELKEKLEKLSLKGRAMDSYEAKTLVALLYASDEGILERALITLANLATLESNQNNLRDAGCLHRLQNLLTHPKSEIRLASIRALGNMALNDQNQKEMKGMIPMLLSYVDDPEEGLEETIEAVLTTLGNVAVRNDWHEEFCPSLHNLYRLVDSALLALQLQSLKLLVNLSTNEDMVPSLLAAEAPKRILYLLEGTEASVEVLLRLVNLLANLSVTAVAHRLNPTLDLPAEDKAASPETMYAAIFGVGAIEKVKEKAEGLFKHPHEDVRIQARRLFNALKSQTSPT